MLSHQNLGKPSPKVGNHTLLTTLYEAVVGGELNKFHTYSLMHYRHAMLELRGNKTQLAALS